MVTAQTDLGLASILITANFLMLMKHAGGGTLVLAAGHEASWRGWKRFGERLAFGVHSLKRPGCLLGQASVIFFLVGNTENRYRNEPSGAAVAHKTLLCFSAGSSWDVLLRCFTVVAVLGLHPWVGTW